MESVNLQRADEQAYIHVTSGEITDVKGGFSSLTGYSVQDVLALKISDFMKRQLRLSCSSFELLLSTGKADGYIFTPSLEAREVTISTQTHDQNSLTYILTEKPESKLEEKLSVLSALFEDEAMSVALYSVPDYIILKANDSYKNFIRSSCTGADDAVGLSIFGLPQVGAQMLEILNGACSTGKVTNLEEKCFPCLSGQEIFRNYTLLPIFSEDRLAYILEMSFDITRRVRTVQMHKAQENELKLQKEKLEAVIENMSDPLMIIDKRGNYETINRAARMHIRPGEILEKVGDFIGKVELTDVNDNLIPVGAGPSMRLMKGDVVSQALIKTRLGDTPYYFDIKGTPIFDEAGAFSTGVLCCRDISESYRHAHDTAEKNKLLSAVIENMHDALAIFDSQGKITFINARAREMYPHFDVGTTADTVYEGFTICDLDENEIPWEKLPTRRALKGETVLNERYIFKHAEWIRVVEVNAAPIFDDNGALISAVVSHHDMTLLYRNQQLIQSKNSLLREKNKVLGRQAKLLDLSNEAIFAWEPFGVIVYWNKGAERMYGYESGEAVGHINVQLLKTVFAERPPDILDILNSKGEWHGTLEHVTKDNRHLIIESRLQLITDECGLKLVLETNRDITERQRMEDELRESELYFRIASEASESGVYSYDYTKQRGYYSTQYKKILGLTAEDTLVADDDFIFTQVHPEDRERLVLAIQATNDPSNGGVLEQGYRIVRPNQDVRWLRIKGQTFFKGEGDDKTPYIAAGVIVDVTEEKIMADKVMQISEELTHIIESTDDFIFSIDDSTRIILCNSAAKDHFKQYFGTDVEVGGAIRDFVPEEIVTSLSGMITQILRDGSVNFDFRVPNSTRVLNYSVHPVYVNGEVVEFTIFGKDITERQNAEREIIRMNTLLEERVAEENNAAGADCLRPEKYHARPVSRPEVGSARDRHVHQRDHRAWRCRAERPQN